MKKKLRVSKIYGEWFYEKEIDDWDSSCYNYVLWGTDQNGREWFFSSVASYNEMLVFVKQPDDIKEKMLNF